MYRARCKDIEDKVAEAGDGFEEEMRKLDKAIREAYVDLRQAIVLEKNGSQDFRNRKTRTMVRG